MSDEEDDNINMEEDIDPCDDEYVPPKITRKTPTTRRMTAAAALAAESALIQDTVPSRPKFLNARVRCPYGCNKVLAQRTIDYHRTNGCRMGQEEPFADSSRKKNYCCGVCFTEFVTRTAFFSHLSEDHDVNASIHHLTFPNKAMFMRFVRWLEAEGGAHFRHKSGAKRRASGKGIFMACNRSGYVGRSLSDPVRNKTGNFRTGYTCTGFIHGTEHNDGTISIEFCGDHYGHDARMRLPNIIKQLIAQKQMDGETFMEIINYLRRQFAPFANDCIYAQRVCLVDLDELRTLLVTTTRKWEQTGIPPECEIWEEEFLEKAGITREGVPRIRKEGDKSTEELAKEQQWPRPHVFTAKMKVNGGYVELQELNKATAETRRDVSLLQNKGGPAVTNVFRENLPTVAVTTEDDDEGSDQEINVDDNPDDSKENKMSTLLTTSSPVLDVTGGAKTISKPERGKVLTRQHCINAMLSELHSLSQMIKHESHTASGTYLVAFMTRIKQLKMSYANGITPCNQPMTEQIHRALHPDTEDRSLHLEGTSHAPEDVQEEEDIGDIGTDYVDDEQADQKFVECINEKLANDPKYEGKVLQFNPAFWN